MAPLSKALIPLLVGSVLGCAGSPSPDGGTDAGRQDGGTDGGADSGTPSDDQCEFATNLCTTGSCTVTLLDDGGIAKRCLSGACDVVTQDCDGGMKCAYETGGRACVPDGTLNEGESCATQVGGCKRGLTCTFVGNDGGSACAKFCRLDGDCTAPQQCNLTLVLPGTNELPLVCGAPPMMCDLIAQDCTDPTEACYPTSTMPGCYPVGVTPIGNTCMLSNNCVKGSACVGDVGARTCRPFCPYPSGEPACTTGTCTKLASSTTVGVCL